MSNREYQTVKEVAEYLRVSQKTILNFIERGDLEAYRVGRQFRILKEEVERYERENRHEKA